MRTLDKAVDESQHWVEGVYLCLVKYADCVSQKCEKVGSCFGGSKDHDSCSVMAPIITNNFMLNRV